MAGKDKVDAAAHARLAAWLSRHAPGLGDGPLDLARLSGGTSNLVVRVSRGGEPAVLRMPTQSGGEKLILREGRLLRALAGTAAPHPALIAACDDAAVLGAPFLLLALVAGRDGAEIQQVADSLSAEEARAYAMAVVDAAAELAMLDPDKLDLGDFGKPDGFLARQVDRWLAMLDGYRQAPGLATRDIPQLSFVADWLRTNLPVMSPPGILHGDIGFSNSIFTSAPDIRVAALLDWETATLGDPLLDLGRAVLAMPGADRPLHPTSLHAYKQYPTREELAERYAARTGRSVAALDYYVVLAHFKLAVILERHYARAESGEDPSGESRRLSDYVVELISRAAAIIRREA